MNEHLTVFHWAQLALLFLVILLNLWKGKDDHDIAETEDIHQAQLGRVKTRNQVKKVRGNGANRYSTIPSITKEWRPGLG